MTADFHVLLLLAAMYVLAPQDCVVPVSIGNDQ